jgi:hypothetical protein
MVVTSHFTSSVYKQTLILDANKGSTLIDPARNRFMTGCGEPSNTFPQF